MDETNASTDTDTGCWGPSCPWPMDASGPVILYNDGMDLPTFLQRDHPDAEWLRRKLPLPMPAKPAVSLPEDPLDRLAAIAKLPQGSAPAREITEHERRRIQANEARREHNRKRIEQMKARKAAKDVDKATMPLVGKDALKRIRGD